MIGQVVCSKAGRDKGKFMIIVSENESSVCVCDGKERPLENPKRKNRKHIAFTSFQLSKEQFMSNRALRRALNEYDGKVLSIEEES